jgi:hypothetical protein
MRTLPPEQEPVSGVGNQTSNGRYGAKLNQTMAIGLMIAF